MSFDFDDFGDPHVQEDLLRRRAALDDEIEALVAAALGPDHERGRTLALAVDEHLGLGGNDEVGDLGVGDRDRFDDLPELEEVGLLERDAQLRLRLRAGHRRQRDEQRGQEPA